MQVRAQYRFARMSPRKIRLLRQVVRGLAVGDADTQLQFMPGKAAQIIRQTLQSAVANAEHNHELVRTGLHVADVIVDEGFSMKRFRPASKGMAHPIIKRTSHVTVVVEGEAPVRRGRRRSKSAGIETISTEQLLAQGRDLPTEEVAETTEEVPQGKRPRRESVPPSKQEEAYEIKKMQQLGGDRGKTHRRKSLGGE